MIRSKYSSTVMSLVCAEFIIFAHWGYSEFFSFQFVFFLFGLVIFLPYIVSQSSVLNCGILTIVLFIAISFAADQDSHMILKGIRTAIVITLLFAAKRIALTGKSQLIVARADILTRGLVIACTISFVIGAFQLFDSLGGNSGFFDIPPNFFALDYGTLFFKTRSVLSAEGFFVRPSALFSEPSALALIGNISFLIGLVNTNKRLTIVGLLTVLVSFSFSGFLICLFFYCYFIFVSKNKSTVKISRKNILVFGFLFLCLGIFLLWGRISNIAASGDQSTDVRVIEPIRIFIDMISRQDYFGLSPELLVKRMSQNVSTVFDNWIFNQIMYYGVLGILPIALLFFLFGSGLGLIILVIGFTNGDLFYYDRLIFLMLLVVLYSSSKIKLSVKSNDFNRHGYV